MAKRSKALQLVIGIWLAQDRSPTDVTPHVHPLPTGATVAMADNSENTGENKMPKAEAPAEVINLVVKDQGGGEVHFKVNQGNQFA